MDDKVRQIIGRFKNKTSIDEDVKFNVTLDTTTSVIKPNFNPINSVIDVEEQFDLERDSSNLYRISGRINVVTAGEINDGKGREVDDVDWDPLFTEFYDGQNINKTPVNWVLQLCYPSEKDSDYNLWGDSNTIKPVSLGVKILSLSSNKPSGNRGLLVVETKQKHKLKSGDYIHINDRSSNNQYQGVHKVFEVGSNGEDLETKLTLETSWVVDMSKEMFLTRVVETSDGDINYLNEKTISTITNTDIDGGNTNTDYCMVVSNEEHGLGVNGFVEFRGNNGGVLNGLHRVHTIVDEYKYIIKPPNKPTNNNYTYRRFDGTPSEYYVRKFELLTASDYEVYPASFSSSVYPETSKVEFGVGNQTWLFHYNKDINTTSLISHRGGGVNELKFCMLKRSGDNPYGWSNVTSHWDFNRKVANTTNGIEVVSEKRSGGVGSISKSTPKTIGSEGSKYFGDIVEYNRLEISERVITEVIFRFGVETDKNGEGYYYNPFKTIDIRKFSTQIEGAEPDELVDGIPGDYEEYPDGSIAWRDLLTPGFIEEGENGVDWPFMNGRHYIYMNNYTYVRRQDPKTSIIDQSGLITINPNINC